MAIRATGSEEIARVAAAVRAMGRDRKIVNDMAKEIRKAIVPIRAEIKQNAMRTLPRSGGLGRWVASARYTGLVRRSPKTAGVTIRGGRNSRKRRTDLRAIEGGSTRHPTWGRSPWHPQRLRPHFFSDAVTDEGLDRLEDAVVTAANNAAERVLHG